MIIEVNDAGEILIPSELVHALLLLSTPRPTRVSK